MTLEEVNSQIALEYGQAMTVRVLKADGEVMRKGLDPFLFSLCVVFPVKSDEAPPSSAIVVVQNATVLDLKKAIRRFMELKQQREGGVKYVSW